jgi:hypothetical protein
MTNSETDKDVLLYVLCKTPVKADSKPFSLHFSFSYIGPTIFAYASQYTLQSQEPQPTPSTIYHLPPSNPTTQLQPLSSWPPFSHQPPFNNTPIFPQANEALYADVDYPICQLYPYQQLEI